MFVRMNLKLLQSTSGRRTSSSFARLLQGTEKVVVQQRRVQARVGAVQLRRRKPEFISLPALTVVIEQLVSGETVVSALAVETRNECFARSEFMTRVRLIQKGTARIWRD